MRAVKIWVRVERGDLEFVAEHADVELRIGEVGDDEFRAAFGQQFRPNAAGGAVGIGENFHDDRCHAANLHRVIVADVVFEFPEQPFRNRLRKLPIARITA